MFPSGSVAGPIERIAVYVPVREHKASIAVANAVTFPIGIMASSVSVSTPKELGAAG
jgi:hypothetical protein